MSRHALLTSLIAALGCVDLDGSMLERALAREKIGTLMMRLGEKVQNLFFTCPLWIRLATSFFSVCLIRSKNVWILCLSLQTWQNFVRFGQKEAFDSSWKHSTSCRSLRYLIFCRWFFPEKKIIPRAIVALKIALISQNCVWFEQQQDFRCDLDYDCGRDLERDLGRDSGRAFQGDLGLLKVTLDVTLDVTFNVTLKEQSFFLKPKNSVFCLQTCRVKMAHSDYLWHSNDAWNDIWKLF